MLWTGWLDWRIGLAIASAIALTLMPLMFSAYIRLATRGDRYYDLDLVPNQPVAIVFGAGVWEDGSPTPMLADRVQAAVDLYKNGRVSKILMTGDNSTPYYNEVAAMQRYAEGQGIPREAITLDYAGFSTYESCYRAREIFGITHAVLVTQRFHLPRAVYTCHRMGIEAVGLGTPDWGKFRDDSMRYYTFREVLAGIKALWEVHISRPRPTFLGPFEGMS